MSGRRAFRGLGDARGRSLDIAKKDSKMLNLRAMLVACTVCASLVSAASASVNLPVSLNGGIGTRSVTSVDAVEPAPLYNWTLNLSGMAATGLTGSLFGMPTQLPLYGTNPADLVMAGSYAGAAPGNLITRNFIYTDLGAATPTYSFSVALDLLADRTLRTTVSVNGLGAFMPGGIIPNNPVMVPVTGVNVGGAATITAVPAPGAAVLAGLGCLLAFRRSRS